jgi:hypothetical protein
MPELGTTGVLLAALTALVVSTILSVITEFAVEIGGRLGTASRFKPLLALIVALILTNAARFGVINSVLPEANALPALADYALTALFVASSASVANSAKDALYYNAKLTQETAVKKSLYG